MKCTTHLDMFDPAGHCLFARDELLRRFAGWTILTPEQLMAKYESLHG